MSQIRLPYYIGRTSKTIIARYIIHCGQDLTNGILHTIGEIRAMYMRGPMSITHPNTTSSSKYSPYFKVRLVSNIQIDHFDN